MTRFAAQLPKASSSGSHREQATLRRQPAGEPAPATVPPAVHETLRGAGQPLDPATRAFMEPRFGHDFSQVRVHTDARASTSAAALHARAYTVGRDIAFAAGAYTSSTSDGRRLLAHELTHVVQQRTAGPLHRRFQTELKIGEPDGAHEREAGRVAQRVTRMPTGPDPSQVRPQPTERRVAPIVAAAADGPSLALQPDDVIDVELVTSLTEYTPPGSRSTYRVGDAAASSILMKIEEDGRRRVTFHWFNFARGEPQVGSPEEWDFRVGAAVLGMNSRSFATVGRALTPAQWQSLWPDPRAALLRMHEEKRISLPDEAVVETYRGMIHTEAQRVLNDNEQAVDSLLGVPNRMRFFQEYANGLREASAVRDVLETRRTDLEHSMAQMQGFSFGMAGRVVNMNPARRLQLVRELGAVQRTLTFWYAAFPLLSRLRTADIRATDVEATLRDIKASIVATRAQLTVAPQGRARFDLWDLDNIRARVDTQLGPRATGAIKAEDTSRSRWSWVKAGAMLAGGIALLFVPGGAFLDIAIGVSMGVDAWERARALGQAAKTGMHVDDALVSRAAANAAEFEAVVATLFAVIGTAGISLRVLRVGRLFLRVRQAAPAMELAAQVRVARVLANNPGWLRAGQNLGELNAAVVRAGAALRFEELQVLRSLVYEAQGLRLPAHSRESLEKLLRQVWGQRRRLMRESGAITERNGAERAAAALEGRRPRLRDPSDPVYSLYSGATEANTLTRPSAEYLGEIADIARGRPAGSISNVQGTGEGIVELAQAGRLTGRTIERTFFRFERAGADLREVGERIYLNVNADRAPEVMRTVVRDIVDNPTQFPGVSMAKLTGPAAVSGRADAIVIYAKDAAAVERVMGRIRTYHAANPRSFRASTPFMTNRVLEGVSLGSEPLGSGGRISFGQVRSQVIHDALRRSVDRGDAPEQFMQEVFEGLRRAGVNPESPNLNLPTGGTP